MPAFTVQALIDRAAAIADMHDEFVTPAQWVAWYNSETQALELFLARNGWITDLASHVENTAAVGKITVTDRALALLGVWEVREGKFRPLRFMSQVDFPHKGVLLEDVTETGPATAYVVGHNAGADNTLVALYPRPTTGTYRAVYLSARTPLEPTATLTDTVQWPLGVEERIVLGMARKALIKEDSDTRAVERLMGEQDQRIEELCWSRQLAQAPKVRNTDHAERGWSTSPEITAWSNWHWL